MSRFGPVFPIGFGTDPLGGHRWGAVDPQEIGRAIHRAVERGVRLFDTADCYGNGLSETRLGASLAEKRDKVLVASKFGVRIGDNGATFIDNSPQWIRTALDASLSRLNTDYIDIYQLHWWDKKTEFPEIFSCLEALVQEGKIRAYGVTNVTMNMMGIDSYSKLPDYFSSFSMEYSLANTCNKLDINQYLDSSVDDNPYFLSWGSLAGGILSGKYHSAAELNPDDRRLKRADSYFTGSRLERSMQIVAFCREICARYGNDATPSQIALKWIQQSVENSVCLVGIKSVAQLDECIDSANIVLTEDDMAKLQELSEAPDEANI